jgi:aspartate kinase
MTQNSPLTVLKFGGTSVQDASAITQLVQITQTRKQQRLVVVSALAKVTDSLLKIASLCEQGEESAALKIAEELLTRHLNVGKELKLAKEHMEPIHQWFTNLNAMIHSMAILQEVSPRSRDTLASMGELSSSCLVYGAFETSGIKAKWMDARKLISTNSDFTSATVDVEITNQNIASHLAPLLKTHVVVTQGFIASDKNNITTTLGRGGSDYSAAVFGAGLSASKVEIWTDVDGILSTDPRIVPDARAIPRIHFLEAAELAYFGAKVLHPGTIYPALALEIPVWILNSKNPTNPGTEITFNADAKSTGMCGIAFKKNVTLVNIHSTRMLGAHGFLKTVFDIFAKYKLSVDLISTSEVSLSLTLDPNSNPQSLTDAYHDLSEFSDVEIHHDRALISVVGGGIRKTPGLVSRIFRELDDVNIQMISMGASELNISFVVDLELMNEVVKRLHRTLLSS